MALADMTSHAQVTIRVELFGQARIVWGHSQVEIEVPVKAEADDIVAVLAESCPELIGTAIREDRSGLQESYTFNLNGIAFVGDGPMHLKQGDNLLLFSSQAGG